VYVKEPFWASSPWIAEKISNPQNIQREAVDESRWAKTGLLSFLPVDQVFLLLATKR
jgi:hypothetical protein